jgi:outer membrane protein OmpA-like peptidoglycan-associated protein
VLPPAIAVPTRPAAPAAPASVSADAPTSIAPLPGGMRVVFGAGRADLNPASEASVRALVHGGGTVAAAPDGSSFTITSFAAGTPEDPSTPRRLSLSRALTLRSVLISQGVASVRIYVRALGPTSTGFADGPADRADIIVAANPVPAPAPVQSR